MFNTFDAVLPIPSAIQKHDGAMPVSELKTFHVPEELQIFSDEIMRTAAFFGLRFLPSPDPDADLVLKLNSGLGAEAWFMRIDPSSILIEGGGKAGLFYALAAFSQMLITALIKGPAGAVLNCGTACDKPRFGWRGLMLDSARHFQSKETVKAVIRLMAHFRLNTFHWHLTDGQGWRIASDLVPKLSNLAALSPGQYTPDDLREVAEFAGRHNIRIIPEIDIPGHSRGLLAAYPQYACDPAVPGKEFCLGNPETKEFLKKIFAELLSIFPDSPIIHLGGDEAETTHWENCPRCKAAMQAGGFRNMRELENSFMVDMTRFIVEQGRTPMLWGTCSGQAYPADTIIQSWLDIREPLRVAPNGNKVVYSVHNSFYFDYPANLSEPFETWMFELSERGIYMADPYVIWEDRLKDTILGPEACLWTETVPEWRVMQKLLPRLAAYSECAWSPAEKKDWHGFLRRKELLEAAGYHDFLKENIHMR